MASPPPASLRLAAASLYLHEHHDELLAVLDPWSCLLGAIRVVPSRCGSAGGLWQVTVWEGKVWEEISHMNSIMLFAGRQSCAYMLGLDAESSPLAEAGEGVGTSRTTGP